MATASEQSERGPAPPRILLLGMMGAGKTSIGRALERLTGWPYLDNDELVLRACGRPTPEVLGSGSEVELREVERAAFEEAMRAVTPVVAAVAAGVVEDPGCRARMADADLVVWLHAPIPLLAERVGDGQGRPWLGSDPAAALARLYEGRERLYREVADVELDVAAGTPDQLAEAVLACLPLPGPGAPPRDRR